MDPKYQELQDQVVKLQAQVNDLSVNFYKNNLSSTQTFNKDCIFSSRLRVPVFSVAPTVAEVGDIIAVAGELFICSSIGPVTWTLVGSQT